MQVLFRAKEKNSNNYVIGYEYYNHIEDEYYITHYVSGSNYKIDRTTRSINIEDMIDSQGNKIFASLQEDGKGGDILNLNERYGENFNAIALYRYYEVRLKGGIDLLNRAKYLRCYPKKDIKVIGIQQ